MDGTARDDGKPYLQYMVDHESTWSRITAMACARYLEDPGRAELHVMVAFDAEQTTEYAREDELYGPYQEVMW
jgi:hypothetical protein